MSLKDDVGELESTVEWLEVEIEELTSKLQDAEDALEGYRSRSLVEIECRRCGRPFRGGGLTDYCTKDCEMGNWPRLEKVG